MPINKTPEQIRSEIDFLIENLPQSLEQQDPDGGVLLPWLRKYPLRFQGVILTAIRGCDGAPKEDPSKDLSRMIRRTCMNPAEPAETMKSKGFFGFDRDRMKQTLPEFFHSLDQYPLHYVMHLMHACEVIAYTHEDCYINSFFLLMYELFCHTFHLEPESPQDMRQRLIVDRIPLGISERNF